MEQNENKKLVIIDGHALVHRSYHALPPLMSPEGVLVNGVYGFALVFLKMIRELQPDYLVATFDMAAPTFRREQYKEYKATRRKMPDNFYEQIEMVHQFLRAFSVPILEKEGYEADDIIGTICQKVRDSKLQVFILTGDLDALQLVNNQVNVYTLRQGLRDQIIYTPAKVEERFHLPPQKLIDWKALRGDPSDNIPGVPSIGNKTAQKLISQYGDLDNLYQAIESGKADDISLRIKEKLRQFKQQVFLNRDLITIKLNVPLRFQLEEAKYVPPQKDKLIPFLEKLGFTSLIPKIFNFVPDGSSSQPIPMKIINSIEQVKQLQERIRKTERIGVLLDYTGEKWQERQVKGLGISFSSKDLFYLPSFLFSSLLGKDILANKQIITFNAKVLLEELSIFSSCSLEDIKILAWLLDSARRNYNISSLAEFFLKESSADNFSSHLSLLFSLEKVLKTKLIALGLETVWTDIEQPLIPILAAMEKGGILMDRKKLEQLRNSNNKALEKLKKEIYSLSGREFNINSTIQLRKILFQELKLPSQGLKTTPQGKVSLNSQMLKQLINDHPIIPLIIRYREREKLKNSFLDKLPNFIDSSGKIYSIWNQTGTATGRLSSEKPNLQNIPQKTELGKRIRKIFIARNNFSLISSDYSQMELRLAAHLSQDPNMLEIFQQDKDIHRLVASYINGVSEEEVTDSMREQAKVLNFGIIYGMGDKMFALQANIPLEKAKQFRKQYFSFFSGLKRYLDYSKLRAKQLGYAETIFGRKRLLPLIEAKGRLGREQERIAVNMPIQGLAADVIKLAMRSIQRWIEDHHYQDKVRIVMQIHDELILEVESAIIKEIAKVVRDKMQNIGQFSVPLKVEVYQGSNWGTMKKVNIS